MELKNFNTFSFKIKYGTQINIKFDLSQFNFVDSISSKGVQLALKIQLCLNWNILE